MLRAVVVIPSPKGIICRKDLARRAELDVAFARLLERAAEDSRALGRGVIDNDAEVVQIDRVAIGRSLLVVVAVGVALRHLIAHEGHHHQDRALTMRRHIERQATHTVGGKLVVVGIHSHHRVGELRGGIGRHQQMRDITDAVVHIIDHLALRGAVARYGTERRKSYKEAFHWVGFISL